MSDSSEAVAQVLRDGGKRLASYGLVLTGSAHEAEELVQAAVVKTFVKRRRLRDAAAAEAYVRATMRTLYIDGIRRDRTWGRLVPAVVRRSHVPDPSDELAGHDQVARALAELPRQVRTAVALRYYDDLTVADIAHHMNLSEGTVKKYLQDGRSRLAPLLGLGTEEPEHATVTEGRAR
ncbi:sigma-70 family RNA polymerase sigma factor [Demequina sp. NBRC 110057]|uniref:sigma-70 family RNA polymerase sigma factor n=1 Tax=Demequina sp. NBRC 110057 TaxID=1570346 RepID=UPI00135639FC|nr:sigma-70 family RNA polymerase sigma factor [Demequina sp. NBRC 110057]